MSQFEYTQLSIQIGVPPKHDPNAWMDEPIKAEKWTNIFFFVDGNSRTDDETYDTETQAKQHADYLLADDPLKPMIYANDMSWWFAPERVSYTIQMPVK